MINLQTIEQKIGSTLIQQECPVNMLFLLILSEYGNMSIVWGYMTLDSAALRTLRL